MPQLVTEEEILVVPHLPAQLVTAEEMSLERLVLAVGHLDGQLVVAEEMSLKMLVLLLVVLLQLVVLVLA